MRWAVGLTLYPGKSYLETSIRILNRTPVVNSFLCFANVAVHVNENYQVIFPPSTQHVTYHAKREFTTWPIATTRYNGSDFTKGVDVSWYKNHFVSNSMFAWNYEDDFFAGYDHGKQAGTMSVADHHVVPGKKLWTWGSGPGGRMWDKILTDDDGPYIELMVGAYSDNQPDYSWIQPLRSQKIQAILVSFPRHRRREKRQSRRRGEPRNVPKTEPPNWAFTPLRSIRGRRSALKAGDKILFEEKTDIGPGKAYVKQVSLPAGLTSTICGLRSQWTDMNGGLFARPTETRADAEMGQTAAGAKGYQNQRGTVSYRTAHRSVPQSRAWSPIHTGRRP